MRMISIRYLKAVEVLSLRFTSSSTISSIGKPGPVPRHCELQTESLLAASDICMPDSLSHLAEEGRKHGQGKRCANVYYLR